MCGKPLPWPLALLLLIGGSLLALGQSPPDAPAEKAPPAKLPAAASEQPAPEEQPAAANPPAVAPPQKPGPLPWERSPQRPLPAAIKPVEGARELLRLHGIERSELESLFQDQPLGAGEEDVIAKLLFRFPRFGDEIVHRWTRRDPAWAQIRSDPEKFRGEFVRVEGRARRVERRDLLPEVAELYEMTHYYQVQLQLPDDTPALVCAREAPDAWLTETTLDEPCSCNALFLKRGEEADGAAPLIFAAQRVAWHPSQPNAAAGITVDHVRLSQHGFDASLLPPLRDSNGKPLGMEDREPFYQLLSAMRVAKKDLAAQPPEPLDLTDLLQQPSERQGELFTIEGNARRVVKVLVEEPDVRERFGIDHYYEIDFFISLDKQAIRISGGQPGGEGPVYYHNFPATLCVLQLPPGLKEGEDVRTQVRAAAAFLKIWSYPAEYVARFNKRQLQPAPMFVAFEPTVIQVTPTVAMSTADKVVAGAMIGSFVLLIGLVWLFTRNPSRRAASVPLPDKISLPVETEQKPEG